MREKSVRGTLCTAMVVILATTMAPAADAASASARNSSHQSMTTGYAKVFASNPQSYTNTSSAWSSSISSGQSKDFWINNAVGSRSITAFSITVTLPASSNVSFFKRCNLGVSFTGPNTCASGAPTTIAMTPGVEFTLNLPMSNATFYQFRITQNKSGTITVATRVKSSDIVPITTNS